MKYAEEASKNAGLQLKKKFTPFSKYWGSPAQQRMIPLTLTFGSRCKTLFSNFYHLD